MWETRYKIGTERLPHMPKVLWKMHLTANGTILLRTSRLGISLYRYWCGLYRTYERCSSERSWNTVYKRLYMHIFLFCNGSNPHRDLDSPKIVCSDNAINFQGGERKIAKMFAANSESLRTIREYVNNGGLLEADVRSFKYHHKRVLGETLLTFEEHTLLATIIERYLNSRPMSFISVDSRDLTPGHIFVERSLRSLLPTTDKATTTKTHAERWTHILAMRNSF